MDKLSLRNGFTISKKYLNEFMVLYIVMLDKQKN